MAQKQTKETKMKKIMERLFRTNKKAKEKNLYFVFDVESVGLHGEGFAVGLVVVDETGDKKFECVFCCPMEAARGTDEGRAWCRQNIPAMIQTHATPALMRRSFWKLWKIWKDLKAQMVTDCGWPVEARFLMQCVDDSPSEREWEGPYPLHDLCSAGHATGCDMTQTQPRRGEEFPPHNPLNDARQSARLWLEVTHGVFKNAFE